MNTFGYDPGRVSEVLWGFLNVAVQQPHLKSLFGLAPRLHGYEAWRRLANDIMKSKDVRYQEIRAKMRTWPKAATIDDVPDVITKIESIVKESTK